MTKIKYVGPDGYGSADPGDGDRPINLQPGEETDVSEEKAAQLADDFPHLFEIDGKKAAKAPKGAAPAADDDQVEDETEPTGEAAPDAEEVPEAEPEPEEPRKATRRSSTRKKTASS